jgi:signal transduction histidine kinase/ActR/RegA family two-component response regulator
MRAKKQELESAVRQLNAVLEQMPSAVTIVEVPSMKVLVANARTATIFREPVSASANVLWERSGLRGLHRNGRPLDASEWPLARSARTGEVVAGEEIEVTRADGSRGFIRVNSGPIRDEAGTIVAAIATFNDVTEEMQAQLTLHEQARINETLLRMGTTSRAALELDALLQELTEQATALCRAQFGSFFYDVTDERGDQNTRYAFAGPGREAFAGGSIVRDIAFFEPMFIGARVVRVHDVTKDPYYRNSVVCGGAPSLRPAIRSCLAVPVKSRSGQVLGGLFFGHAEPGVFTDADERLLIAAATHAAAAIENARLFEAACRAERAAQRAQEKLRHLFMQAPALIAIHRGADHVFEFVNAAGAELVGDVVGKAVHDTFAGVERAMIAVLDGVFRTGESFVGTEVHAKLDWNGEGRLTERFFNVVCEAYRDASGVIEGVMTFGFEVTDQVFARRKVEAVVGELETASRMKDEFLATVSHELRTPLNAILGWVRMLRSGTLPDAKHDRALETIERNANAQTQLIEDLLDVSRIISGKLRLEVTEVDLAAVVDNAIEAVRPAAHARGVELKQSIDPSAVGVIAGDGARLQQVVWNLVTNAVKFTPKGGVVQIAARRADGFVEIAVSDTGHGIEPEFLGHVFERFRQADATTTRKHGGLGLGLAIVRHLVELHGGSVGVESEGRGKGATFRVHLPTTPPRSMAPERPPALRLIRSTSVPRPRELAGMTVLVVDDEPDARELLAEVLGNCDATVFTASNVAEALQVVDDARPSIIVSDIGMPGEDGYAFIEKLRALPANRGGKTPAVALTAYARFEDRTKALVAGFNMHVPKPVELAELLAALASLASVLRSS